jgi:hypothetical protein
MENELERLLSQFEETANSILEKKPPTPMFHKKHDTDTRTLSINVTMLASPPSKGKMDTSVAPESSPIIRPQTAPLSSSNQPVYTSNITPPKGSVETPELSIEKTGQIITPAYSKKAPVDALPDVIPASDAQSSPDVQDPPSKETVTDTADLHLKKGKDLEESLKKRQAKLDELIKKDKGQTF